MEQKRLLTQASGFVQARRRRRWLRAVTGMAAVVVFVTTYLLILPAITMENSGLELTAPAHRAALGETLWAELSASADGGQAETFFVLTADGDNAGLDESRLYFDGDGTAVVRDEGGQAVELHREYTGEGAVRCWFVLEPGQSVRLSLPWVNGVDRWRSEVTVEQVPVQPETPPVESLPVETPPAEEPPVEVPPAETAPGEDEPTETPSHAPAMADAIAATPSP